MGQFLLENAKSLLEEAGIFFRQTHGSLVLNCPRCKKPLKLWIYKSTGRFKCFYCESRTDPFSGWAEYAFLELTDHSLDYIKKYIYTTDQETDENGQIHLELKDFEEEMNTIYEEESEKILLPEIKMPLDSLPIENKYSQEGRDYLESRGIPLEIAKKYGIYYHPMDRRVLFPAHQYGALVGFQGRLIVPNEYYDEDGVKHKIPKALTFKGYKKESWLMFADNIKGDYAILCEGPVDAIKADLCGNNVCSLGKNVSDEQMQILIDKKVKKLYLALDPDAVDSMSKLMRDYSEFFTFYDLRPPAEYKDIGEMSFEQVKTLFDNAQVINPGNLLMNLKDFCE